MGYGITTAMFFVYLFLKDIPEEHINLIQNFIIFWRYFHLTLPYHSSWQNRKNQYSYVSSTSQIYYRNHLCRVIKHFYLSFFRSFWNLITCRSINRTFSIYRRSCYISTCRKKLWKLKINTQKYFKNVRVLPYGRISLIFGRSKFIWIFYICLCLFMRIRN